MLGWRARPHEETLEATVAWHLEREHDRIARTRRSQQIQYRMAGRRSAPPRGRRAWCAARSSARRVAASVKYSEGSDDALPLQGPHGPGVPLRQGGAPMRAMEIDFDEVRVRS